MSNVQSLTMCAVFTEVSVTDDRTLDYESQPGSAAACFTQLAICFSSSSSFS